MHDYERGPYTESEKLGLRAADRVHRSAHDLDDDFYTQLKRSYSDAQIIELMATAAAFDFFTRFVDALCIPTTPVPDKAKP